MPEVRLFAGLVILVCSACGKHSPPFPFYELKEVARGVFRVDSVVSMPLGWKALPVQCPTCQSEKAEALAEISWSFYKGYWA